MHILDIFAVLAMAIGYVRGRRRGLDRELYKLINLAVAILFGCGLFRVISRGLTYLTGLASDRAGLAGFLAAMLGALFVMHLCRRRLRARLAARFGGEQRRHLAGLVGLGRWGVGVVGVVAALVLTDLSNVTRPLTEHSVLGKLLAAMLL